jgi:mono/diheme cytochrome c family protein
MRSRFVNCVAKASAGFLLFLASLASAQEKQDDPKGMPPVSLIRDIAPILVQKCIACHGPEKTKGGYQLHTFELALKPGDSKHQAITPGEPEQSELYRRISTDDEDDRMPQKDQPLTKTQIALIRRWIKEGARFDSPDRKAALVTLIPRAPHPDPPENYPVAVPILALAFRPDGKELAASGYHEITFWNPENGTLLRRMKGLAQRTQCLAYSRDGSLLAAAGGSPGQLGEVVLLDPVHGSILKILGTISDMMLTLCFSPDGTRLAAGGADNSIHLYDVLTGAEQLLIQQHADWVMALSFSHDGSQIASASRDKTARIFDVKTGELESTYVGHSSAVFAIAFSSDDKAVYTGGRDKKIHLWNAKEAKKTEEIAGFEDDILRIVVDGDLIYSCSADKIVRCHSASDRKLARIYSGHSDWVYSLALHPESKRLAAGSHDGEVRVWNIQDGRLITAYKGAPGFRGAEARK